MIIKISDERRQQLVNKNQLYPVLAYRVNANHVKEYRIFDEGNSFSWLDEHVDMLCNNESDYYMCMINSEMLFIHKKIESDFFVKFYLEEDEYGYILKQLDDALKAIIMQDLNVDEIMQALRQMDTTSYYFTLFLDCFFNLSDKEKIKENIRYFADCCDQLYENDIRKIVEYVESIDSEEVKYFFEHIASCDDISDDIMNRVYGYLYD